MKYIFSSILILVVTGFCSIVRSQEIKNIVAVQEGNQVKITYDLTGATRSYNIKVFYTLDKGKTWLGPLLKITGDAGEGKPSGTNKIIIWDAIAEKGNFEGTVQFKVEAEMIAEKTTETVKDLAEKEKKPAKRDSLALEKKRAEQAKKEAMAKKTVEKPKPQEKVIAEKLPEKESKKPAQGSEVVKKQRTVKIALLASAIASAGVGILTYSKANSLYDEYNSGSEDAANLRKKIESLDNITPIGLGIAGICGAGFIYTTVKQGKPKKQVSLNPYPVKKGGGITLTLNF